MRDDTGRVLRGSTGAGGGAEGSGDDDNNSLFLPSGTASKDKGKATRKRKHEDEDDEADEFEEVNNDQKGNDEKGPGHTDNKVRVNTNSKGRGENGMYLTTESTRKSSKKSKIKTSQEQFGACKHLNDVLAPHEQVTNTSGIVGVENHVRQRIELLGHAASYVREVNEEIHQLNVDNAQLQADLENTREQLHQLSARFRQTSEDEIQETDEKQGGAKAKGGSN